MKEAMWDVDGSEGMAFEDPRTRGAAPQGQLTLWAGAGFAEPELRELVEQRLQSGPAPMRELGDWLLLETARWRRQDAREAVRELLNRGAVSFDPPGSLKQISVIKRR